MHRTVYRWSKSWILESQYIPDQNAQLLNTDLASATLKQFASQSWSDSEKIALRFFTVCFTIMYSRIDVHSIFHF